MSELEPEAVPDMRTNVLRQRKLAAENRAEAGARSVAPGGNALTSVLSALESAWVSPSGARTRFAETLDGVGGAIPSRFRAQAAVCRSEAWAEPVEVDYDDPGQGWKADGSRIDARVSASSQNPYYQGGY